MGFLGMDWGDVAVGAVSMIPGWGPVAGGLLGAGLALADGKSVKDALQEGLIDGVTAAIPGGKWLGKGLAKVGGLAGDKLAGKAAGNLMLKVAGKVPGKAAAAAVGRGSKGVGRSFGRAAGRGIGGFGASWAQGADWSGGGDKAAMPKVLPTRPAGKENRYSGGVTSDNDAVIGA